MMKHRNKLAHYTGHKLRNIATDFLQPQRAPSPVLQLQCIVFSNSSGAGGKGSSASKKFCAVMNLPPPPVKFQRYNGILLESLSKVSDASMKKAVEETVEMNNSNIDITAAFDGS
ncbi:hypothetical protein TNCV_2317081 [Trichonephila clavipes]|nr:hypothetical protein TNCV_2317081 [Trichonephila clavipes]